MEAGTPSESVPTQSATVQPKPKPSRKPRRPAPDSAGTEAEGSSQAASAEGPRRPRGPPRGPVETRNSRPSAHAGSGRDKASSASPVTGATSQPKSTNSVPGANRSNRNPREKKPVGQAPAPDGVTAPPINRRAAKFNAGLTDSSPESAQSSSKKEHSYAYKGATPQAGGLTATLIHALKTPPYSDCPICFAAIHPAQPTWSCSPSHVTRMPEENGDFDEGKESESSQCCWTTFHLKCIRSWAGKSVKEISDAWRARGEERAGEWRCPGCQTKRTHVPNGYCITQTFFQVLLRIHRGT
ncbi:hypothetical protein HWV62_14490 [Athelia sp. TMB]|nr:hypothetical protein HWV62_14490 [Athelia sp. TMB]